MAKDIFISGCCTIYIPKYDTTIELSEGTVTVYRGDDIDVDAGYRFDHGYDEKDGEMCFEQVRDQLIEAGFFEVRI